MQLHRQRMAAHRVASHCLGLQMQMYWGLSVCKVNLCRIPRKLMPRFSLILSAQRLADMLSECRKRPGDELLQGFA